jgi:hypothetical protein
LAAARSTFTAAAGDEHRDWRRTFVAGGANVSISDGKPRNRLAESSLQARQFSE